jgi:hypothetical protein
MSLGLEITCIQLEQLKSVSNAQALKAHLMKYMEHRTMKQIIINCSKMETNIYMEKEMKWRYMQMSMTLVTANKIINPGVLLVFLFNNKTLSYLQSPKHSNNATAITCNKSKVQKKRLETPSMAQGFLTKGTRD